MLKRLSIAALFALSAGCAGDSFKPSKIISGVSPNTIASGRTKVVEIHGDFTKWKASSLEAGDVSFGADITVDDLTIANEGFLLVTITAAGNAATGPRDIDIDGEILVGVFQVVPPFEIVESSVAQGGYAFVDIIGFETDWVDGLTVVELAADAPTDIVSDGSDFYSATGFEVLAPNYITGLVKVDLFAAAGGVDLTINGLQTTDTLAGALSITATTITDLTVSANIAGVTTPGVVAYRIPAGALGDLREVDLVTGDLALVYDQDDGQNPIADLFDGPIESLVYGNGLEKNLFIAFQDGFLQGGSAFEFDYIETALAPTQIMAGQITLQTIPAAGAVNYYYYSGADWNITEVTLTPTAAVSTLDGILGVLRDAGHEELTEDSGFGGDPEVTNLFLNSTYNNAFITVENFDPDFGADTEFTIDVVQTPLAGTLTVSGGVDLDIPDGGNALTSTVDPATGFTAVTGVHLALEVTHPWRGDLVITLTSPSGISVDILDQSGGSADNVLTVYPDLDFEEGNIADFNAETNPDGIWTLSVQDLYPPDAGTLVSWALSIEGT